ncbi:MAG TPA: hypothetical protein DCS93_37140 [Microscillaceae bacterium]|nr:hypothetical protein [Microscillaceae bacterium]
MRRFFYTLTILFWLSTNVCFLTAQENTTIAKQVQLKLKRAEKLFDNEQFPQAIDAYRELLGTVASGQVELPNKETELNAHLRLGLCYLYGTNQSLALQPLKYAHQLNPDYSPLLDFHLGDAFVYNRKYHKAVQSYQSGIDKSRGIKSKYLELIHDRVSKEDFIKVSNKRIKEANFAKKLIGNPLQASIYNLGPKINTANNEYAPIVSNDNSMLIFTGSNENSEQEDVLISHTKERKWEAKEPWQHFNSKHHESAVFLSLDGNRLLIYQDFGNGNLYESQLNIDTGPKYNESSITSVKKTRKRRSKKRNKRTNKTRSQGMVSSSQKTKQAWSKPKSLGRRINSKHRETSGCLSPDGNTLYFTSDRPGGLGGLDIYMAKKDKKGRWSKPVNLGPKVNTPYDEEAPFVHPDGTTLYFSSVGHNSIGGFDIFKVTITGENDYSEVENLGFPINSQANDMYFVSNDKNHRIAYFSSDRSGGVGGKDLYRVIMNSGSKKPLAKGDLLSFRVFFKYKEANIPKKSLPAVEALASFMKNNPGLTIEVGGHTDNVGTRKNNHLLSQQRAEVVYQWLVSKGIDEKRLVKKGYGSKSPVIPNETHYARILNRRTDFRVVALRQQ